jgi:hypothetical protein
MAHLSNGTQIFVEGSRGPELTVTAVSNAARPVMTIADSGLVVGDYIIVTSSNWSRLAEKQLRVVAVSGSAVTVEGIDTTSTTSFPAPGNAVVHKILSWFELPCVTDVSTDGGEQQSITFQCLSDDREQTIPTYKSAVSTTYTFAHDYTNPVYPILRQLDESGELIAVRAYVPRAQEMRLWTGTLAFNETPQVAVNEVETLSVVITVRGRYSFLSAVVNA